MKFYVEGKEYDTRVSKKIGTHVAYGNHMKCYMSETLYLDKTGNYFLYGKGCPLIGNSVFSKGTIYTGNGFRCSNGSIPKGICPIGQGIALITESYAKKWATKNLSDEEFSAAFMATTP